MYETLVTDGASQKILQVHMLTDVCCKLAHKLYHIKTHDSESRGQEEPVRVIYKEHRQKTRKCSSQAAKTARAQLSQP